MEKNNGVLNETQLKLAGLESISDIKILCSRGTYYIGRECTTLDGQVTHYSGESGPFKSLKMAKDAFKLDNN